MPTYDYVCDACGHAFELVQSMKDDPLKKCPKCRKQKLRDCSAPERRSFSRDRVSTRPITAASPTRKPPQPTKAPPAARANRPRARLRARASRPARANRRKSRPNRKRRSRPRRNDPAGRWADAFYSTIGFRLMSVARCPICGRAFELEISPRRRFAAIAVVRSTSAVGSIGAMRCPSSNPKRMTLRPNRMRTSDRSARAALAHAFAAAVSVA